MVRRVTSAKTDADAHTVFPSVAPAQEAEAAVAVRRQSASMPPVVVRLWKLRPTQRGGRDRIAGRADTAPQALVRPEALLA